MIFAYKGTNMKGKCFFDFIFKEVRITRRGGLFSQWGAVSLRRPFPGFGLLAPEAPLNEERRGKKEN